MGQMVQIIEEDLMKEFESEMKKVANLKSISSITTPSKTRQYKPFWDKFLVEDFPEGQINNVLEKNFAIWIYQNDIDLNQVIELYKNQKWNPKPLLGWFKKVANGELKEYNAGEVYLWAKQNKPDLCSLLLELNPKEEMKQTNAKENEIKLLWHKDLKNYKSEKVNWIIDNIIKERSINVLAGKRSTLKSWLCLIAGFSIAKGIDFLGTFKVQQGNVLYLDRENQFDGLKERSDLVTNGLGITEDLGVAFLSESYIKIDSPTDLLRIEKIIKDNNIKLMICDVYRRLIGYDENDAREVSKLFVDGLKPLTERTGVAILLIHHEKKGESSGDDMDMLRGSSDLANYVDMIIQVDRKGEFLTIKQNKNRSGKELEPFQVKIDTDTKTFFKLEYKGAAETTSSFVSKIITNWILDNHVKEFTYTKILKYCEDQGYKKNNIVNALSELQNSGIIVKGNRLRDPYIVSQEMRLDSNV